MSEVDKMTYYDLKTNEIWADSNIAGFHDEHIEIDEVIAPLIRELNIKGYKTKFCCWGTLRKEGAPRLLCFKFNNSCVKSV